MQDDIFLLVVKRGIANSILEAKKPISVWSTKYGILLGVHPLVHL